MYKIIEAIQSHLPFIINSFLISRWNEDKSKIQKEEWMQVQKCFLIKILSHPKTKCLVAVDDEDDNQIYGYVIVNENHVIWGYVKNDFRKEWKIWDNLIKDISDDYSYIFPSNYVRNKKKWTYNPVLMRIYNI